ncbi:aspartyl-tRNA synthetase-like protein [Cenococcum geophilum 1.58]|uniref:aspartyl-tRNA synthetase-like protein n=1 Tax=Cenococcum geophilum 1.58 TaxID=794803 RepID=UPI00358ED88C|nr:aspartyl-tRNA synthetase-like protein [Cenococcum geophilum 1.58]
MTESEPSSQPSKKALKKAAKEAEKAKKKAERSALLEQQELELRQQEVVDDSAAENYGEGDNFYPQTAIDKWIQLRNIEEHEDRECVFRVAVANTRSQSAKLAFLTLSQGLESIQMVVAETPEYVSRPMIKFAVNIPPESICTVFGVVKRTSEKIQSTTIQDFELQARRIYIVSKAQLPLPLQPADSEGPLPLEDKAPTTEVSQAQPLVSLNTRLNNRVLDLRAKLNHRIFLIKDGVDSLFQEFLRSHGFIRIHTPKIMGAPTEGGSSVFRLDYFHRNAYLAQSPQLAKQMAIQSRFPRVMEIGPVFRAENSNTVRHLTEFTGLDMEMEILEDYHEVVDILEKLMLFIFNGLNERYGKETELIRKVYAVEPFKLPAVSNIPRIEFSEGVKMLREAGETLDDYDDLTTPQEKKLGQLILEKYNSDFYTLDQFPTAVRPFYTMPSKKNKSYSNSFDMFMRGQEILSGAQRIHIHDLLIERIREHEMSPDSDGLRDYVEGFKFGCPPHGGGGIGLERIVQFYLGLPNIRMTSLFPRDPSRVLP